MELQAVPLSKPVIDILQARKPTRVAVFLRRKSPLYPNPYDEVVQKACSTLGWQQLTILVFDIFHDEYDVSTAHRVVKLLVILVDYGKRLSYVRMGSLDLQEHVNVHVAKQHNYNGWDGKPPFFEDQTGPVPPKYYNPRDTSML
ncbi:hypothetical protein BU26DRAFT_533216 [Trematosphaeria pertusa]|uniref:Uncharacterized protein n=1 Tax=Trematosphaeria pertusa TaxID=390896 RepID=A0A6A6I4G4_9PLEO|nr:uncharacterized protein BU26DRAFT_533216 [Trematosphaeria pertusa]KAF2245109.1 hypothetical protein BU26DRAFT_533216 [Trematosphaeria pertusa]